MKSFWKNLLIVLTACIISGAVFAGGINNPSSGSSGGSGTVTSVSVTTANGVSGTVATATTTPAITLILGTINPTSVGATTSGPGTFSSITVGSCSGCGTSLLGFTTSANSALGSGALAALTTGVGNTAIGVNAGNATTTGSNNLYDGYQAANANINGTLNVILGYQAALTNLIGSNNTIIGGSATTASTGSQTAVALGALSKAGTGDLAIGYGAMNSLTADSLLNVGLGYQAGFFISSGGSNTAVGAQAMLGATASRITGTNNTAIGTQALKALITTATGNTALGSNAGALITTGAGNIAIGNRSLGVLTVGSNNIYIGNNLNATTTADINTINIAGIYTATATATAATSVPLIHGTPSMPDIPSSSSAQTGTLCWTTGGSITYDPTVGCLTSTKENKESINEFSGGLAEVMKLKPVSFYYKDKKLDPSEELGLLAEDVKDVEPRLVGYGSDGKLRGVRYEQMTAVVVSAVQELNIKVNSIPVLQSDPCSHLNWLGRKLFCK